MRVRTAVGIATVVALLAGEAAWAAAKTAPGKPSAPPKQAQPAPKPTARFPAPDDYHWGYLNKSGQIALSGYEAAGDFAEGLACVKIDGKYGYADPTGKQVLAPQWEEAGPFSEGLAPVRVDKLFGYIDKTGKLVIDAKFEQPRLFHEGLAIVKVDGKCGAIGESGGTVIEPTYEAMLDCSEGLIPFSKEKKWGFLDKTGAVIIPPQFDRAGVFVGGLAPAFSGDKGGFIDKTGKWVIEPTYDAVKPFHEGLAAVGMKKQDLDRTPEGKVIGVKRYTAWGFVDPTGKEVIPLELVDAGVFSEGLVPAVKDGLFGFFDKTGARVLTPSYAQDTKEFHNGLAATQIGPPRRLYRPDGADGRRPAVHGSRPLRGRVGARADLGQRSLGVCRRRRSTEDRAPVPGGPPLFTRASPPWRSMASGARLTRPEKLS